MESSSVSCRYPRSILGIGQNLHTSLATRIALLTMIVMAATIVCACEVAADCNLWPVGQGCGDETGCRNDGDVLRVARRLRLGTEEDLWRLDCAYEMDRIFNISPESRSRSKRLFVQKALLTISLLTSDNASSLAIRTRSEMLSALGRRVLLKDLRDQPTIDVPDGMIAVDLHVHTSASPDSLTSPTDALVAADRRGLMGIAVTDHDSMDAVERTEKAARRLISEGKLPPEFLVIPGEEVSSSDGHIVGLFLHTRIPPGQTADWTIRAIHEQGGIAIAAHPLVPTGVGNLANTLPFDAVETESASEKLYYAITPGLDKAARVEFYASLTKPGVGSSDGHDAEAIAECYTLVACSPTLESLRKALKAGQTQAAATATAGEEQAIARRTVTRLASMYRLLIRMNPLIPGLEDSETVSVSLLPCPAIRYIKRF